MLCRAALGTAAATIASLGFGTQMSAAAEPGQVCQIQYVGLSPVYGTSYQGYPPASGVIYLLDPGVWFRVEGYSGVNYLGHGDGKPNGYLRRDQIVQSTCHFT